MVPPELVGCWQRVATESTSEGEDAAEMNIGEGGDLDYVVLVGDRWQVMKLIRRLGAVKATQLHAIEDAVRAWLGLAQ